MIVHGAPIVIAYHFNRDLHLRTYGQAIVLVHTSSGRVYKLMPTKLAVKASSTGFDWGFIGSASFSLAHSLLSDRLGKPATVAMAHAFKEEFVQSIPHDGGAIRAVRVDKWIEDYKLERVT